MLTPLLGARMMETRGNIPQAQAIVLETVSVILVFTSGFGSLLAAWTALVFGATAGLADQPVGEADPVADCDLDALVHQPPRKAGTDDLGGRLHVERGAMRGDHAPRREAGLQLVGELGAPPERAQIEFRQRSSPSGREDMDGTAAASRR